MTPSEDEGDARDVADAYERAHRPRSIGESIGDVLRRLVSWTDDDWKRSEAEAARVRDEQAAHDRDTEAKRLVARGAPARAVERLLFGTVDGVFVGWLDTGLPAMAGIESGGSVVLAGAKGTGKTTAAVAWMRKPIGRKLVTPTLPVFVHATDIERLDRYSDADNDRLRRAGRLVIDDLGVEYIDEKGSFSGKFDGLLNARYASALPTLITTNLPAADFRKRYGERVFDRLRETGRWVSLTGESLRRSTVRP